MKTVNVGIIGCGYWGQNYIRVFREINDASGIVICDLDNQRMNYLKKINPGVELVSDAGRVFQDPAIDAVVISTSAHTHYALAKSALQYNKHLLVEKPLTLKVEEAGDLVALAKKKKRVLMVSHTFLFNPAIIKMKKMITAGDCGVLYYLYATRTHLGLIRKDVNAIWDLAPHDVAIFSYLLGQEPLYVNAVGSQFLHKGKEDVGFITLVYPRGVLGNIHVGWINSHKVREVVVVGSKKRIVFDDLNNLEKLKVFDKGISVERDVRNFGEFQLLLRDGDILSPKIEAEEPLKNQCRHFLDCIRRHKKPLTDGENGLAVVRVMEAVDSSMRNKGIPVKIR